MTTLIKISRRRFIACAPAMVGAASLFDSKSLYAQAAAPAQNYLRKLAIRVGMTDLSGHDSSLGYDLKGEGEFAGLLNDARKLVSFQITFIPPIIPDLEISYTAHIQNAGWMNQWVKAPGEISSFIPGNYRQIEALKVMAEPSSKYRIAYQGNMYNGPGGGGGTGWIYDGNVCGSEGQNRPLTAIDVVLFAK